VTTETTRHRAYHLWKPVSRATFPVNGRGKRMGNTTLTVPLRYERDVLTPGDW